MVFVKATGKAAPAHATRRAAIRNRGAGIAVLAGLAILGATSQAATSASTSTTNSHHYTVHKGDTVSAIAKRNGVTVDAIVRANNLRSANRIRIGQVLTIPVPAVAATTIPVGSASGTLPKGGWVGMPADLAAHPERLVHVASFQRWAKAYNVPMDLVMATCWMESGWQNQVVSSVGARGIGQLMPATVAFVGPGLLRVSLDPAKPDDNIRMAARYLRWLLDQTGGDTSAALASYYQGLRSVRTQGWKPTTGAYVQAITNLRVRFAKVPASHH